MPIEPDPDSLALLLSNLWSVPSTSFRCTTNAPLSVEYQAASDGGDFFVLCHGTDRVEPVTSLTVRQPGAPSLSFDVFRSEMFVDRGESFTSGFPLYVSTTGGSVRYAGVVFDWFDSSNQVLELHLWLPHDRQIGTWTVEVDGVSATFDVEAPCAAGPPGVIDPFDFPASVPFADVIRTDWVDGSEVREHCLALPDVVGQPSLSATQLLQATADRRSVSLAVTERAGCHVTGSVGDVVVQGPGPGSFGNSSEDPSTLAVDLTVSVAECPVLDDWVDLTYGEAKQALDELRLTAPWFRDFGFCASDDVVTQQVPEAGTRSPDVRLSC